MKEAFQAKDIQKIVGTTKSRYDYLSIKIGITPDVEEVEGTGRANLYSFKNLLQFAFAHHANDIGLSPKATRRMIMALDRFNEEMKVIAKNVEDLQKQEIEVDYQTNYSLAVPVTGQKLYKDPEFHGIYASIRPFDVFELYYVKDLKQKNFQLIRRSGDKIRQIYSLTENGEVKVHQFKNGEGASEDNLRDTFGYIRVGLSSIIKAVIGNLS